ncbi:hypothetical protein [Rhizohabitans arisaemae]|uniref:hypothetical protein n=1 Tax=Rhizohabitans arisaemae TaxID=2720610 RepID=UPI0024B0F345|nr:hypothetical protein [Rhizohabitans arisaemae]
MSGSSPWSVPLRALLLSGRFVLPLTIWFSAGYVGRTWLAMGGARLEAVPAARLRLVALTLLFCLLAMACLMVTVGMLRSMHLPVNGDYPQSLDRAVVPFTVIALVWGLPAADARAYHARQEEAGVFTGLAGLSLWFAVAVVSSAVALCIVLTQWYRLRGNRVAATGAVFCKLTITVFGLIALGHLLAGPLTWLGDRVVVAGAGEILGLLGLDAPRNPWAQVPPYVRDGLLLPLIWLTTAILVYGAPPGSGRRHGSRGRHGAGAASRGAGVLAGLRLLPRIGVALLGLFVLCYVAVKVGADYAERGVMHLIGNEHPQLFWNVIDIPLSFAKDLIVTVLTLGLLGAVCESAVWRHVPRGRSAGEAEPRRVVRVGP